MNLIPVLGIPHYNNVELTARCIASIDYPVEKLVLVFNSPIAMQGFQRLRDAKPSWVGKIEIAAHPNAGVAGAWNEIIKLFPAPWWLISNNDIMFAPGDLAKMAQFRELDEPLIHGAAGLFYGNHGASFFGITSRCVEKVGHFDENIYPAYLEDCDYARRCDLMGQRRANVQGCAAIHGYAADGNDQSKGSCTVNASPQLASENSRTHQRNHQYYFEKWGGNNGHEKFKTPFADPHWPIWAWRFEPCMRQGQQWKPGV